MAHLAGQPFICLLRAKWHVHTLVSAPLLLPTFPGVSAAWGLTRSQPSELRGDIGALSDLRMDSVHWWRKSIRELS